MSGTRAMVADAAAVVVLAGVMSWEYVTPLDDGTRAAHPVLVVSVAASLLTFLPILVRRFVPFTALVVAACALWLPGLVLPVWSLFFSGFVPVVFLLYTVARHRPIRLAIAGALLLLVLLVVSGTVTAPGSVVPNAAFLVTFEVLVIGLGVALRRSAEHRARLVELLGRLEAEQADQERLAVLDERTALARDLHDVVAHAVSLMLVQAGAARLALSDDAALARRFLVGVEEAGRDATGDLRHMLDVLRAEGGPDLHDPAPGLAGLAALADRMRASGLDVELTITGAAPELQAGLDVAAYRIVQEALTNVVKHAGATRVRVEVDYGDPIRISVQDDGPRGAPPAPTRSGHGLVGMRERAALFGGRVDAGPVGRGFTMTALLPVASPS